MDEDDFYDTISIDSTPGRRKFNNKEYLSLSKNTLYYSAMDLDNNRDSIELDDVIDGGLLSKGRKVITTNADVDYVLAYECKENLQHKEKREQYESNLRAIGLILEKDESQVIHFTKIFAPKAVLCQYAEILKLRLPIKSDSMQKSKNFVSRAVKKVLQYLSIEVDSKVFPHHDKDRLTYEYSRDKDYLFDSNDPNFFTCSAKIMIVDYILERETYADDDHDRGIKKLVSEGVYKAAYPLHDGDCYTEGTQRKKLRRHWASLNKWIKYQPIDEIKDYFGAKFALYFTWLGFYTHMLIPAALVGVLCFFYGLATMNHDTVSKDICSKNITMCPRCDRYCDYWELKETCTYSKIQHLIDNPATIFFAVFMSFWAALYLELWERYSAEITHRWGLVGFDILAEPPRPEYLERLKNATKKRINVVTNLEEPAVSFWKVKLPSIVLSFTVVVVWICISLGVVSGVIIYRMSLLATEAIYSDTTSYRIYVVPVTAALLNLIGIQILNFFYDRLAHKLTEMELQRTQTEYDDSLTLKCYMFQFVNFYSSIFYIAFLKGKFVGYPAKYNRIFGLRQEECNPGGCLMELTIQLAIIMIGNQALGTLIEMVVPIVVKMYKTFKVSTGIEKAVAESKEVIVSCNQWTEDYKLNAFKESSLFQEYLEMVLQYGFVTIFVTAFPLAPLFALVNNVLEMRLDAKKFINYYRRPVPSRVKDIGVWMPIMSTIGRISIISNAFIIAFSSNFIPKLVYKLKASPNNTEDGFLEFSLAKFHVNDFQELAKPLVSLYENVTTCRYSEFRNDFDEGPKYKRNLMYWHIMAARLAFIVVFQNFVGLVIMAVKWTIPHIPRKLNDQIKKEAYKTNEIIIKYESQKNKERMRRRKRASEVSTEDVELPRNGDVYPTLPASNRSTQYFDAI